MAKLQHYVMTGKGHEVIAVRVSASDLSNLLEKVVNGDDLSFETVESMGKRFEFNVVNFDTLNKRDAKHYLDTVRTLSVSRKAERRMKSIEGKMAFLAYQKNEYENGREPAFGQREWMEQNGFPVTKRYGKADGNTKAKSTRRRKAS